MKKRKAIFIFISEEGFGHSIRICSILNQFPSKTSQKLDINIFTGSHIELLKQRLKIPAKIHFLDSGLLLKKNRYCSLDQESTLYNLRDWEKNLSNWEKEIISSFENCDLIISDSVPQASLLAKHYNCKSINISHFTWDWMYEEINLRYSNNHKKIDRIKEIIDLMKEIYDNYDLFIFPPLTPKNNLILMKIRSRLYKDCNFILSDSFIDAFKSNSSLTFLNSSLQSLLLMNNGTYSLTESINDIILNWSDQYNINLIVSPVKLERKALININKSKTIYTLKTISEAHSAITNANHFLARCGYNTLTESLFTNANPILVLEESNPEIESNLEYASNKKIKIIKPINITTEEIISIIKQSPIKKSSGPKSSIYDNFLLRKGCKECVDIIEEYLN